MTTPHKATPEHWELQQYWANCAISSCILELRDRLAALEAAATPPPVADHSRGAREMVATDGELIETFYRVVGLRSASVTHGFRAIYNLGRQHGTQLPRGFEHD